MHNEQEEHSPSASPQQTSIQQDPYAASYPESAARYLPYRIFIVLLAIGLIVIGKSNLPTDSVPCIQDVVIDWLLPITNYYFGHEQVGIVLMTLLQVTVDVQLVAMLCYWYAKGHSFRYPLLLTILGSSKVLLNVLFQTRPIPNSFTLQAFPSLVLAENFSNTYFFSGIMCLLMFNLLELHSFGHSILFKLQLIVMAYSIFLLLSMRLNFFMDVTTGLVFGHYMFYFINDRISRIDQCIIAVTRKIFGQDMPETDIQRQEQGLQRREESSIQGRQQAPNA